MALPNIFDPGASTISRRLYATLSANGTVTLPKNSAVTRVYTRSKTANAVTGGLKIGTTSGGTEILATIPVQAGIGLCNRAEVTASASFAAAMTLYIQAVTSWNSGQADIVIEYEELNVNA